ncbi:MAG: hypothetical protein HYZ77_04110, partial [Serratia liquefaciens]|nr:hypothetical protein [Serratia liquefaciens]
GVDMVILNSWERQQVNRRGDPGCPLCGHNWAARDGTNTGIIRLSFSKDNQTLLEGARRLCQV